jgi:hypothetical protein
MLVDMKPVIQCMVVSSAFATARLPITALHRNVSIWLVELRRLSASGERERYTVAQK